MFYRNRLGRTNRRKGVRRVARKGYKKVSPSVRSYVKKAIHRQIENKERIDYAQNYSIVTGGPAQQGFSLPLLPAIPQGIDDGQRIGNQVKCVKGIFRATINLKDYNASTNNGLLPVWIKCFIVRALNKTYQDTSMPYYDSFFKGNGTTLTWQGTPLDLDLPVNTDEFRVLKTMTFKLGSSQLLTYGSGSSYASYGDNSPFAKRIVFNYAKWCRKQLKFSDGVDTPSNDNLYLAIQPVWANGNDTTGKITTEIHYCNTFMYEDA